MNWCSHTHRMLINIHELKKDPKSYIHICEYYFYAFSTNIWLFVCKVIFHMQHLVPLVKWCTLICFISTLEYCSHSWLIWFHLIVALVSFFLLFSFVLLLFLSFPVDNFFFVDQGIFHNSSYWCHVRYNRLFVYHFHLNSLVLIGINRTLVFPCISLHTIKWTF